MLRVPVRTLLAALAVSQLCSLAWGQGGQYGSVVGYVYDQSGTPIAGVKIAASSPTQIGGVRVAYTNAEGYFHITALQPGEFEVQASAPQLRTVIQKDVKVGISAATEVSLVMEVQTAIEDVRVEQKAPIVSTSSANLKEEFDLEFVQALPVNDREGIHSQMVNEIGGVVGGRVRGGSGNQTIFTQDGFDMKGQNPTLKASAAFEILAGGYGADNAMASGGLVNLVTKSGSNRFELEFFGSAEASPLRLFLDGTDSRTPTSKYVVNPTVAGPIIKDRLWFAFNTELHVIQNGRDRDPNGFLPDPLPYGKLAPKGTLKLTWQVTPRNKVQSVSNFDTPSEYNRVDGLGISRDAQQNRHTDRMFTGLIWESLLSDNLVLRSQVGFTAIPENIYPRRCSEEPVLCDHVPSVTNNFPVTQVYDNATTHDRNDDYTFQFANRLEWFLNTRALGEHNLVFHDTFYTEEIINKTSRPGDVSYLFAGADPVSRTTYYANDPRYQEPHYGWFIKSSNIYRHLGTISDSWRLTRYLTLTPALSHIWATGSNSRGDRLVDTTAIVPSAALAWDATHDGRTVVRSSYSTYVDADINALAMHTVGNQTSQTCQWDAAAGDYTRNCTFSGGLSRNTFGSPCGPSGIGVDGRDCREALRMPRTWEYTFGGEREVVQGIALSADLVYRKYLRQYERVETNRIWNTSGTDLAVGGQFRNGRNETISDMETPANGQRRYAGATFGIKKREGKLKIFTYYTLSRLDGNIAGTLDDTFGAIAPRQVYLYGSLPDDHRHEVKTTLVYQMNAWLMTGVRYEYYSGFPYSRTFRNDVTGGYDDYRALRGVNPGSNVNDPGDDRPLRVPDLQSLNAQVRINWMPLIGQRLETFVDWLNLLALRTTTSVQQTDGPTWATQTGRMGPMTIRIGLNYRY